MSISPLEGDEGKGVRRRLVESGGTHNSAVGGVTKHNYGVISCS